MDGYRVELRRAEALEGPGLLDVDLFLDLLDLAAASSSPAFNKASSSSESTTSRQTQLSDLPVTFPLPPPVSLHPLYSPTSPYAARLARAASLSSHGSSDSPESGVVGAWSPTRSSTVATSVASLRSLPKRGLSLSPPPAAPTAPLPPPPLSPITFFPSSPVTFHHSTYFPDDTDLAPAPSRSPLPSRVTSSTSSTIRSSSPPPSPSLPPARLAPALSGGRGGVFMRKSASSQKSTKIEEKPSKKEKASKAEKSEARSIFKRRESTGSGGAGQLASGVERAIYDRSSLAADGPESTQYSTKNLALTVSPPLDVAAFAPGHIFKVQLDLGSKVSLSSFDRIEIRLVGNTYEPPDQHDFLLVSVSVVPRSPLVEDIDLGGRSFAINLILPGDSTCGCRDDPFPLPSSMTHQHFRTSYRLELIAKKTSKLGATEKLSKPFAVHAPSFLRTIPIVSKLPSPAMEAGHDNDWVTATSRKVIEVADQALAIETTELAWQIHDSTTAPHLVRIPYRLTLTFSTFPHALDNRPHFSPSFLTTLAEKGLRLSISRRIVLTKAGQKDGREDPLPAIVIAYMLTARAPEFSLGLSAPLEVQGRGLNLEYQTSPSFSPSFAPITTASLPAFLPQNAPASSAIPARTSSRQALTAPIPPSAPYPSSRQPTLFPSSYPTYDKMRQASLGTNGDRQALRIATTPATDFRDGLEELGISEDLEGLGVTDGVEGGVSRSVFSLLVSTVALPICGTTIILCSLTNGYSAPIFGLAANDVEADSGDLARLNGSDGRLGVNEWGPRTVLMT
ncbi:hypothetical protein JCM1841_001731 [Sporobolomyces salmonicolor]